MSAKIRYTIASEATMIRSMFSISNLSEAPDGDDEPREQGESDGDEYQVVHAVSSSAGESVSARARASSGNGLSRQCFGRNSSMRLGEMGAAEMMTVRRRRRSES